jgi:solute carrier family 35 protein E1
MILLAVGREVSRETEKIGLSRPGTVQQTNLSPLSSLSARRTISAMKLLGLVFAALILCTSGFRSFHVTPSHKQFHLAPRLTPSVRAFQKTPQKPSGPLLSTPQPIVESESKPKSPLLQNLKVGALFALWYVLNIGYNVSNKKVLNMVPELTYTVAFLQQFIGWFYLLPIWAFGVRKPPILTQEELNNQIPMAVLHTLTHLGAVVSLGAGAVSFTHIVKAAEPAVSALLSAVFLKSFLPLPVYLSLIPVIGGVALASATELSFTWLSFWAAMISNIASASRGIVGKNTLGKPQGKNMNAANVYAVMTMISTLMCLPVAIALEWKAIVPTLSAISASGKLNALVTQTLLSGFYYYLYNEVAFLTLDNVSPVTHALGNTIKRVVIIIASVLAFGTKMSSQGAIGSAVAIGGVLLYSLAKNHFH